MTGFDADSAQEAPDGAPAWRPNPHAPRIPFVSPGDPLQIWPKKILHVDGHLFVADRDLLCKYPHVGYEGIR